MRLSTTLRRKRGLIFKVIISIPILWFSFIGFIVVISGSAGISNLDQDPGRDSSNPRFDPVVKRDANPAGASPPLMGRSVTHSPALQEAEVPGQKLPDWGPAQFHPPPQQPVLERPNPDKMRLEERMREAAAEELRQKEQLWREQKLQDDTHKLMDQRGDSPHHPVHDHIKKKPGAANVPGVVVDPSAPGEMGKGVTIDKTKLSQEERRKFDDGWQKNAFNQYASDMISVHRSLPDVRDAECKTITYAESLPDTSVIIIFHNEAQTILERTVFSVLDRSPTHLIREVILVDDFSDLEHLGQPLQDFADRTDKVKLVRGKKREGLIRARLLGASVAKGDVLTYLDSHCECTEGWLEPMLARIGEDESNVACPVIDVIEDETLKYVHHQGAGTIQIGGFDWNLQYNWHPVPDREKMRRKGPVDPIRSPTMAGGLFAISRNYFEKLGTYDPGMDIWGGENLELSFRTWMCGGTLEIIPCSHVGHIFRKRSPYSWKTGVNVVKKNSVRLAEVWMDEYKSYYYERFNFDLGEYGDVTARRELRKKLNCKSFDWFVQNIYPELFIPGDSIASGEIRNKAKAMCLDSSVDRHSYNKPIKMWPCHNQGGNQYFMMSKSGEMRRDEGCMDYAGQFVMIYPCHGMKGNQEWVYGPDNTLRHGNTNMCMELSEDGQAVSMKPCTGIDRQIWLWKRKTPDHEREVAARAALR